MGTYEHKGEPVQMLFVNNNDEFKLNLEIINKICNSVGDRSFVVYSINGLRRSGKSFLFNYVIRYLNEYNAYFGRTPPEEIFNGLPSGFKSRGGDEKVTIGIWIWSEPLIVRQNGEEIAILLVDAQGNLDNSDKRSQSSVFFAISSMISDVFIYNIFHEISDDLHTQFVEMFLDFTKHFQDNKMDKFQTLLMLVRDFKCLNDYALGYYDRKTKPDASPANYMINKLCPSKCLEEKRSSRQAIENNYKHVAVFLAAFPGVAIYFDQFKGDPIQIEPHFKESVKCLLVNIFNPPIFEVKKIAGEKVNGFKFLNYIMKWAELLENAPEPIVFNLAKAYAEVSNRNLVDKLLEKYKSFLNEYKKPVDEELLKKEHEKNLNDCFEVFDKEWKLGSLEILEKFKKILEEEIEIRWRDLRLRNRTKSEAILKKRSQKALKEYNIEMSEFCSTAQDENELIEKHDKILISHFQTYDNELKLGSEKMRSEFMKQFKEKSTLNLNNYKTRNEIKSTEALIKLENAASKIILKYSEIDSINGVITIDAIDDKQRQLETFIKGLLRSLKQVGNDRMRNESREKIFTILNEVIENTRVKVNTRIEDDISSLKNKLIEGFNLVLINEQKLLPIGSKKLLHFKKILLDYSDAKINALQKILKAEKLKQLKVEIENRVQNAIEKEIRKDSERKREIMKNFIEVLPVAGSFINFGDGVSELKHGNFSKGFVELSKGAIFLGIDIATVGFGALGRAEIAGAIFVGKSLYKVIPKKLFKNEPNAAHTTNESESTPITNTYSIKDMIDSNDFKSIKDMEKTITREIRVDPNYTKPLNSLIDIKNFKTIDDFASFVNSL